MSICFIESREIFLWISYETYCLKVSLNNKLILSQFSQKEITIFFLFKSKQKQKIEKQKKKNSTYSLFPPHLFRKKMSLMDLFWGGNEKICDIWLNLAICQSLFSLILQSTNQLVPFFKFFYFYKN